MSLGKFETLVSESASERREYTLRRLERNAVLQHLQNKDGDVVNVIDTEKLKGLDLVSKGKYLDDKKVQIFNVFKEGLLAVSKEQFEKGDLDLKQFLYVPETIDDALNPAVLREANFYIALWDFKSARGESPRTNLYPTKNWERENDVITELEAKYAFFLYNKEHGAAYRDSEGTLFVRDPDTREYSPASQSILEKLGLAGTTLQYEKNGAERTYWTVQESISKFLPHLEKRGLLTASDFREVGHVVNKGGEGNTVRRERVSPGGSRMFNGVSHYLGKEFVGKNVQVVTLSRDLGGIFETDDEGNTHLAYTFNLFDKRTAKQTTGGSFYAGPERTQVSAFDITQHTTGRYPDENEEEYAARIQGVQEAGKYLPEFLHILSLQKISLYNRPLRDQLIIAQAANLFKENNEMAKRFINFVEKFSNAPLDCFSVMSYGHEYASRLLEISESVLKTEAEFILTEYKQTMEGVHKFAKQFVLDASFEGAPQFKSELEEAFARRVKDILNVIWELTRTSEAKVKIYNKKDIMISDIHEATEMLGVLNRSIRILNALFKNSVEGSVQHKGSSAYRVAYQEDGLIKHGEKERFHHFTVFDTGLGRPIHVGIQVRERGVDIHHAEKNIEFDAEARINFLVDYEYRGGDVHALENVTSPERARALSIRLDRESFDIDRDGSILHADAGRDDGCVSLDLGSLFFDGNVGAKKESISEKLGRVVAVGNMVSAREDEKELGKLVEYYHNRRSFSERFGDARVFAEIVSAFERGLVGQAKHDTQE